MQAISIGPSDWDESADIDHPNPHMAEPQHGEGGVPALTVEEVEHAALALPRTDRERIAEVLHASLIDPEVQIAWDEEIQRSLREVREGKAEMIDGEEVERELDEMINRSRPT